MRGSEQNISCKSVDDNANGLNVQSVVQVGSGSVSGMVSDDTEVVSKRVWASKDADKLIPLLLPQLICKLGLIDSIKMQIILIDPIKIQIK